MTPGLNRRAVRIFASILDLTTQSGQATRPNHIKASSVRQNHLRIIMNNETLINTFEMICERLGNIESNLYNLTEREKNKDLQRVGKLVSRLFGWQFDVIRRPDLEKKMIVDRDVVSSLCTLQKRGPSEFSQARVELDTEYCLPLWYDERLESVKQEPSQDDLAVFEGVDLDILLKQREETDLVTCEQASLESDYIYVLDDIAQRATVNKLDSRFQGVRYDSGGFWLWTKRNVSLTMPEWVEAAVELYAILGHEVNGEDTVCVTPLSMRTAELASMTCISLSDDGKRRLKTSPEGEAFKKHHHVEPVYVANNMTFDGFKSDIASFLDWKKISDMYHEVEEEVDYEADDDDYEVELDDYEDELDDLV